MQIQASSPTGKYFIVLGKPAPRRKPGEGALNNPAMWKDMKTARSDLLPINHGILWCPDASQATPGVFDDLDLPAKRRLDPLDKAAFVVPAIGPVSLLTFVCTDLWF